MTTKFDYGRLGVNSKGVTLYICSRKTCNNWRSFGSYFCVPCHKKYRRFDNPKDESLAFEHEINPYKNCYPTVVTNDRESVYVLNLKKMIKTLATERNELQEKYEKLKRLCNMELEYIAFFKHRYDKLVANDKSVESKG